MSRRGYRSGGRGGAPSRHLQCIGWKACATGRKQKMWGGHCPPFPWFPGCTWEPENGLNTRGRENHVGEKILAGLFAALTLIKLAFLLISPEQWLGATQAFLGHYALMIAIYLVLLVITGYVVFTRIDLIDVAVVMLFTSVLVGLSLIPYLALIPQLREAIVSVGFGKAWPALIIWAVIAVAVLYRLFANKKGQEE